MHCELKINYTGSCLCNSGLGTLLHRDAADVREVRRRFRRDLLKEPAGLATVLVSTSLVLFYCFVRPETANKLNKRPQCTIDFDQKLKYVTRTP